MAGLLDYLTRYGWLAPAQAMSAKPPETPASLGLLGRIHEAIDPVQAFGGYGNMLSMALPMGAPETGSLLGKYPTTTPEAIIAATKRQGGYTVHLGTGEIPDQGLMVGRFANASPNNVVVQGYPTRQDLMQFETTNRGILGKDPAAHLCTWYNPAVDKTYIDVAQRYPAENLRPATKFGEKTGQEALFDLVKGEKPVGNWREFVAGTKTPEGVVPYAQRLQEMNRKGADYLSKQPGYDPKLDWWDDPDIQRVYGKENINQMRGFQAATSTNTKPSPNVQAASEYMRRYIAGEPLLQPDWTAPKETTMGGYINPGSHMGLEKGRAYNLGVAARGSANPADYRGGTVQEKVWAQSGDPNAYVLDRIHGRLAEQPSAGVYTASQEATIPDPGVRSSGALPERGSDRELMADALAQGAKDARMSIKRFSSNVWAGIRQHVIDMGELYGTDLRGVQKATAKTSSGSYNQLFMQHVMDKAKFLGLTQAQMEEALRKGSHSLLSFVLATPFVASMFRTPTSPSNPPS